MDIFHANSLGRYSELSQFWEFQTIHASTLTTAHNMHRSDGLLRENVEHCPHATLIADVMRSTTELLNHMANLNLNPLPISSHDTTHDMTHNMTHNMTHDTQQDTRQDTQQDTRQETRQDKTHKLYEETHNTLNMTENSTQIDNQQDEQSNSKQVIWIIPGLLAEVASRWFQANFGIPGCFCPSRHYIKYPHPIQLDSANLKPQGGSCILMQESTPQSGETIGQLGNILPQTSRDFDPEAKPELKKPLDQSEISIRKNLRKICFSIRTNIMLRNFIKKWSGDSNSWSGTRFHWSGEKILVFRMTER